MRRGFSLVEILVYAGLSVIVALAVASLFVVGRRSGAQAASSYLLGRTTDEAVRVLREDLQAAPLGSVRIDARPSSLSFLSAAPVNGGAMVMGQFGVPAWQKRVSYTLVTEGGVGRLVRWEEPFDGRLPVPAATPAARPGTSSRVVLHQVVAPGASVEGAEVDPVWGGFRPRFVLYEGSWGRGKESLTTTNPMVTTAGAGGRARLQALTRLLDVQLQVLQPSGMGRQDFVSVRFRVHPRY